MVALIDCNNFYCSCERVFQPFLEHRPLIVLSNNDGCAIARSEEAKQAGIKMGTPAFMISDLIRQRNVAVQSSNYVLYGDMSERVMQVIRSFVPKTEVYSIDEIFADLSGMKYVDIMQLARQLRETVIKCTGIPVSIGIAPTKTLAKMANRFAKKIKKEEGIFCACDQQKMNEMLQFTEVGDIWGIGKEYQDLLIRHGFSTAARLLQAPEAWIRKNLSVVGQRLVNELKGIPCIPWEEQAPAKKNIRTSRSFGQLVTSKKELRQAVAKFTSSCGEKLRKEKTCARRLEVFIQTNPHRAEEPQYFQSISQELHVPTNHTSELMRYALQGLEMIFQPGYKYQKAGVMALDLVPAAQVQLGLFDQADRQREQRLMETLDQVNSIFGRDIVRYGVQDYGEKWKLRQQNLSPCFTTRLSQIPKAG